MENAQLLTKEEPSALDSVDSTEFKPFTPRQRRVLEALLENVGWITRESVDRIAGASNGPQIILELRRKVTGHDGIEMQKAESRDRDGKNCQPGRYRLTSLGRERALALVRAKGPK
jgi:hypothetical protein